MARYNLIMKDQTYMLLLKQAASQGYTMGKYINIVLNKVAAEGIIEKTSETVCADCGKPAISLELWPERKKPVCFKHSDRRIECETIVR